MALAWPAGAISNPPGVEAIPSSKLLGSARLTVFGFEIYNARLWAGAGFSREQYVRHPFALELAYLRNFEGEAIAQRSIKEMERLEAFSPDQARQWLDHMKKLFPNVKKGDRLTGIYQPGEGVSFLFNDRPLGEVKDPVFARVFMGIWLSPKSSEPEMRRQLLAGAAP